MSKYEFSVVNGGRHNGLPARRNDDARVRGLLTLHVNPKFAAPSQNPEQPIHLIDLQARVKKSSPHQSLQTKTMICFFNTLKEQSDDRPYLFLLINKDNSMDYRVFDKPYTIEDIQKILDEKHIEARAFMSLDLRTPLLPQLRKAEFWSSKESSWDYEEAKTVDCIRRPDTQGIQTTAQGATLPPPQ